jgi:hypothetical protein
MGPAGLENRYRRLLRWYPAGHRAVHQEEMLGVLMAGAEPGRTRPSRAESADLLLGAARIRLRPGRALSDGPGWRDALAVYSIAAPLLVLLSALIGWLPAELEWPRTGVSTMVMLTTGSARLMVPVTAASSARLMVTAAWVAIGGQGLVAVLALLGLRRWAAAAAAVSALYLGSTAVLQLLPHTMLPIGIPGSLLYVPFALITPISEAVALLASPGPRRGRQLMRRREWALLASGSAVAAALTPDFGYILFPAGGESLHRNGLLLAGLIVVLLLVALWLSSAHGKRLALLFGVLAYGLLMTDGLIDPSGPFSAATINGSVGQVLVALLLAAVIYRTWRPSRSAARESGQSLT